ncbi:MAG: RNA helicase required for poly(A+) mRNA export [Claussenomyces sp. TS43310]|nr:MAG: RNA helicase required for poly(A+) mRNA export [Claussenomyces sp. TS43310]
MSADLAKASWADDVSPTPSTSLDQAQGDGSVENLGGSALQEGEYDVEVKLSDLQADVNNPLYSVSSFENLGIPEQILKGIYSMNFKKPSKIQEKALPLLLSNPPQNMIAQSQSGTGKTAAFVLTILTRLDINNLKPQALCLAPSRELARQIEGVVRTIGQFLEGLVVQAAVPGALERGKSIAAHVVVGTPGTVMDLIKRRQFDASQLKVLCLDEADNMLDQQGLGDQCSRVKRMIPQNTQILLFSATFPDQVMTFAQSFSPKANEIKLKHEELTVAGIKQMFMDCPSESQKYDILVKLYGLMTVGSSIIFVKLRSTASEIERRMVAEGHKVAALHGAYDGAERDSIIDGFRSGKAKVLITTNVLARGIDVQSVSMVINYDIPMKGPPQHEVPDPETYLHRIGRTGRFGRVGVSISFVYDQKSFMGLSSIAKHYGIDLVKLDHEDWDATEEIVQKVIKSSRSGAKFSQT